MIGTIILVANGIVKSFLASDDGATKAMENRTTTINNLIDKLN